MGSVLGATMAGIFVGFHEVDLLFSKCTVPMSTSAMLMTHSVYLIMRMRLSNFFSILIKCTHLFDLSSRRVISLYHFLMFLCTKRLLVSLRVNIVNLLLQVCTSVGTHFA